MVPHSLPQSRADDPKKTWSVTGSAAGGLLCPEPHPLLASLTWLILLSTLFVSIFLPFTIPHSTFKATRLLANFREREGEEGRVYSLYSFSIGNSLTLVNLFTPSAPLSKTASGTVGTHQSRHRRSDLRLRRALGSRIPSSTGEGPQSQQPYVCPLPLPGSQTLQGANTFAGSNTRTTRWDSSEEAVQCLWGCTCNKERISLKASLQEGPVTQKDVLVIDPQMCHPPSAFSSCPLACLNFTIMYLILKVIVSVAIC